jgi:sigma-B regulation protein RsbU (phosphoserine phosphatase)
MVVSEDGTRQPNLNAEQQAVPQSEAMMRTLLESASEGIIILDRDGRIVLVNAKIEEMFGHRRDELLGQTVQSLVPGRFQNTHASHCASYFRNPHTRPMGAGLEIHARRKDGAEFPAEISLSFAETEGQAFGICFVTDITERKQAEEALREYSERLEEMVDERTRELRQAQVQLLSQQRLQQELELAMQVQTSLLPRQVPILDGFDFAATALPARYVSGDLYDFVSPDPDTCHIVLADISGKGLPAALLTLTARTLFRAETEYDSSPASILASVNSSFYKDLVQAETFITFFAARLDARLGTLTYANAGHTETLWCQYAVQGCRVLPSTGLPIGIYSNTAFREETLVLRPGDTLVFYSDGITEAANSHDELYGQERLADVLSANADLSAFDLSQVIVDSVEAFRVDAPRSDDLTLIVLKVLPRAIPFVYPAELEHLNEVTAFIRQMTLAYGGDFAYAMELAASEIVTNIIQHAYRFAPGELRGHITLLPDRVELDLYDDGTPFDISAVPEPSLEEPHEGGYGLFIARQLADELAFVPATPDGNHWRLVKVAGP